MSTTTASFEHIAPSAEPTVSTAKAPRKSFYQRLIEARTQQAQSHVRSYLRHLSDAQLADIGYSADQIRDVREGVVASGYWS